MFTDERPAICITGNDLTCEDIVAIGMGEKRIELDIKALERSKSSRKLLEDSVAAKRIIYGVNTSLKTLRSMIITGYFMGDPILPDISLAILAVRLNALVKGYSGVRIKLLELMRDMINAGIAPYIPECGSVGASGDLVHLAHMALAIIGEGKAYLRKELCDAREALEKSSLAPISLSYKEGLALVNGTAAMTALSAFTIFGAKKLLRIACVNAAFAVEIFGGIDDAFDMDLHAVKPHLRDNMHEQIRTQENSDEPVFETNINVQDVYSIRCTPQILAPVSDAIDNATETIEIEANSSNDNPIVIPEKKKIIHGGNFHGQSVSFVMDALSIAISTLCNLSERRINKLLHKDLNEGLPEHLIPGTVGLTMGFMGAQYLATSVTAENRHLANPVSTHSISCNASNQDVVSMGTVAARKALRLVNNAKHILTLEILADLQALSFRNSDKLGNATTKIYNILQEDFEVYDNNRIFHDDLVKFRRLLFSSQIFDDLSCYWH